MTTFWVLETARTTYWTGKKLHGTDAYSDKIDNACKFEDFVSAEIVRCWLLDGATHYLRAVEHGWMT